MHTLPSCVTLHCVVSVHTYVHTSIYVLTVYTSFTSCKLMQAGSAHQVGCIAGTNLQPTTSGASFGSFTDAADSLQSHAATRCQEEPSAFPTLSTSLQAWHPSQGSPGHQWPSSPQWQTSQGSVAQPWPSSPHWQAPQGGANQPWPASPQWAQAPTHQPVSAIPSWSTPNHIPSSTQLPPNNGSLSNGHLATSPSSSSSKQKPSTQSGPYAFSNGNRPAVQEPPLSLDAGHAATTGDAYGEEHDDDDGFGDFAAADHASHSTAHAPAAAALQSADRCAPAYCSQRVCCVSVTSSAILSSKSVQSQTPVALYVPQCGCWGCPPFSSKPMARPNSYCVCQP